MKGSPHLLLLLLGIGFVGSWLEEHSYIFSWVYYAVLLLIPAATLLSIIYIVLDRIRFVRVIYDKPIWYGEMRCISCGYLWRSRKNVPPKRCANCGTKNVSAMEEKEKAIFKAEKSNLTDKDWEFLKSKKIDKSTPAWFSLLFIICALELMLVYAHYSS